VADAMQAREDTLRDLAQRRRAAHVQLAQLKVGRDRLREAYAVVRATAEQASEELTDVVNEARLAAEAHADEVVGDETKMSLEQLESLFGLDRIDTVGILADEPAGTDPSENEQEADVIDLDEAPEDAAGDDAEVEEPARSAT
jgi:hypothetical protein